MAGSLNRARRLVVTSTAALGGCALGSVAGAQSVQKAAPPLVLVAARAGAASDLAVYRSTDGAEHWVAAGNGLPRLGSVLSFAVDRSAPLTVYAAIDAKQGSGLYKTTDGGQRWTRTFAGPLRGIAIDPSHPQTVYLEGNRTGLLMRSPDGGEHWQTLHARACPQRWLVGSRRCIDLRLEDPLLVDPRNPMVMYTGPERSTDGGRTWRLAFSEACYKRGACTSCVGGTRAMDLRHPNVLYGVNDGGISKSTDAGQTWVWARRGNGYATVAVDPTRPQVVWTVKATSTGGFAVEKSTDGGSNWSRKTGGPYLYGLDQRLLNIDSASPNTVYVAGAGVRKTADGGTTWAAKNGGIPRAGGSTSPPPIVEALAVA